MFRRRKRKKRKRKKAMLACMNCGSRKLEKKRIWDGPVTYEHDTAETQICLECGHSGIPLVFYSEEELEEFRRKGGL